MTEYPPTLTWSWIAAVAVSSAVVLSASGAIVVGIGGVLQKVGARLPEWSRWVLFMPAAFAAGFAAESISRVIFSIGEIAVNHHLLFRPGVDMVMWQLWGPLWFVLAGLWVAPSRKFLVFLIVGGIKGIVALINLDSVIRFIAGGGSWTALDPVAQSPTWWNAVIYASCVLLIGTVGVLVYRDARHGARAPLSY